MPALRRSTVRSAIKAVLDAAPALVRTTAAGSVRLLVVIDRRHPDDVKAIEDELRTAGLVVTLPPYLLSRPGDTTSARGMEYLHGAVHVRCNESVNRAQPSPLDLDVVVELIQSALLAARGAALTPLTLGDGEHLTVDLPDDVGLTAVGILYRAQLTPSA